MEEKGFPCFNLMLSKRFVALCQVWRMIGKGVTQKFWRLKKERIERLKCCELCIYFWHIHFGFGWIMTTSNVFFPNSINFRFKYKIRSTARIFVKICFCRCELEVFFSPRDVHFRGEILPRYTFQDFILKKTHTHTTTEKKKIQQKVNSDSWVLYEKQNKSHTLSS